MGKASGEKGKRGERELAAALKEYGYNCRRGQQYCGIAGDANVVGLLGVHIECKRTEKLSLYDALAQATADAQTGGTPAISDRRITALISEHCKGMLPLPFQIKKLKSHGDVAFHNSPTT